MGDALGLKVSEDKPEIIKYVNKFRNVLYNSYASFELFNNVFHCIQVSTFKQDCTDCCSKCYEGFTLPPDIIAVEAIYNYGQPLTLNSRWRESHTGLGIGGCGRVNAVEMAEMFPTERDLQCGSTLKIFTEREEDADKCVHITVLTLQNKETTLTLRTISDGWAVTKQKVKKILSVSLPPDRVGSIILAQNDGYVLSEYAPWESVPSYRRFKISGTCNGVVLVQGTRQFRKIYFDHDIVEVGDDLVIEAAGKYFKYGENTADANEIAVADRWLNNMGTQLNGLMARHRGKATQDGNPTGFYRQKRKALPGYEKHR